MDQNHDAPPVSRDSHLTNDDISHLNALAIAYYILGGLGVVFSLFTLIHIVLGLAIITGATEMQDAPPFVGWLFFGMGLTFLILGEAVSIGMILSGRRLKRRTNYMFSFVLACIICINVPIGTILGIFTILVLNRESVKAAYGRH